MASGVTTASGLSAVSAEPVALSNLAPKSELTNPTGGVMTEASRADHQHPRLTSSTRVSLSASGVATVTYTRTFVNKPVISLTAINPTGRQIILEVTADIQTGGLYTGCTIKGSRSQLLPDLTGIVLLGNLLTALSAFDPVGGSASGVEVNVVAIQASN